MDHKEPKDRSPQSNDAPPRRAYESPRITETGDFEHLVLSCFHFVGGCPVGFEKSA